TQVQSQAGGGAKDTIVSLGGTNIILGGDGGDEIHADHSTGPSDSNVILGDNGTANFGFAGSYDIQSDLTSGGDDTITGGVNNTILRGFGRDTITRRRRGEQG